MKIGEVVKQKDGSFKGSFQLLSMRNAWPLEITPVGKKESDKHPDWHVSTRGHMIGAGWSKTSKEKKPYISMKIDPPELGRVLRFVTGKDQTTTDANTFALFASASDPAKEAVN